MFANFKNRIISAIAPDMPPLPMTPAASAALSNQQQPMQNKFAYARPLFLQLLTPDELRASADHNVRPIIVPRDITLLPWGTGYAECVNSGKSKWNEDQASFCRQVLYDPSHKNPDLPYTYFGIFDGHAGFGAALAASKQFHHILHEKLVDCLDILLRRDDEDDTMASTTKRFPHPTHLFRRVSKDEMIIGALESAFFDMDKLIEHDQTRYRGDVSGCTACVALFINGKMFVANAGDSRAVLCQRKNPTTAGSTEKINKAAGETYPVPFSFDHTPETERHRLLNVVHFLPKLLGQNYVAMEYAKRPHMLDLGRRVLCRQGTMNGWTYKTLTRDDIGMPVVTGEGKRSRLLGTLGVTRGFGDHFLYAMNTGQPIKPFLTPHPDVNSRDLSKVVSIPDEHNEDGDYGILVMATDGLWDVSENEAVATTVFETLVKYPTEKHRYTMVAQELVAKARGKINDSGHWRLADTKAAATVDDISVIVIPVYQYYKEHMEWEQKCARENKEREEKQAQLATEALEDETSLTNNAKVESDNEEEVIVEVNRQKVQAQIEIENDHELEEEITLNGTGNQDSDKDPRVLTDVELDATISALSASNLSTTEDTDGAQSSPTSKGNKSKPQQRNRNRKENKH